MRKFFTILMFCFLFLYSNAQIETCGGGSGNLSYASTPWDNSSVSYSGTGDTRVTLPSDYSGASGERNVFLTNNGSSTLIISNITVLNAESSGQLCFGIRKATNAENGSSLLITYVNASGASSVSLPTGGGTSTWYYECIDLAFTGSPISITFTNTSTAGSNSFRLDDIGLTNTVLPITWNRFSVENNGKSSLLSFSTASETNNSHFDIERSADGRNFEVIGTIKGAGDSRDERRYEFTDERPVQGINYYRIKQIDYDGKYSYSDTKSVRHIDKGIVVVAPRNTDGRLDITTDIDQYEVSVWNASGQQVSSFHALSGSQSIDISTLQSGIYFVKVTGLTSNETVRILKY